MKLIYVLAIPFMQSNFNNCKMILRYICLKHPFKNKANQCHNQRHMFLYHNHLNNSHSRSCIVPHFYSFHKHVYTEVRMSHWCTLKINIFQHIYVNLDNLNFRDHDKTSRYQEFEKSKVTKNPEKIVPVILVAKFLYPKTFIRSMEGYPLVFRVSCYLA